MEPENVQNEPQEDFKSFSVDDYQTLLQMLNINLPSGALTAEVCERSTHTDLLNDSRALIQELKSSKLTVVGKPCLSCVDIKKAHGLKERGEILKIVRFLFFKGNKDPNKTLKKRWEKCASRSSSRFRMRDTYTETPISIRQTAERSSGAGGQEARNSGEFVTAFLRQKRLTMDIVTIQTKYPIESGFISGRLNFLVDVNTGPSAGEKIIFKDENIKRDMVGDVITLQRDGGNQVAFKVSHQSYHQTQAYLYLLKKQHPGSVTAGIVVKVTDDTIPRFYWAEVSDNTENIEGLNQLCQKEALPRFLAVLNLIFQKVEESGGEMESVEME